MRTITEALNHHVLLTDGSITRELKIPELDLDAERDFFGAVECSEVLNLTRYSKVVDVHKAFLRAGADIVRTNSLRANPLTLRAYGLEEEAFLINFKAAEAAAEAVDSVPGEGRRRFVMGVVRDDGWDISPGEVEAAACIQVEGLIAGGADGILLDVLPGVGRIQAMLEGASKAREKLNSRIAILLQRIEGGPRFGPRTVDSADGIVQFRPGDARRAAWLDSALRDGTVNLIGGGSLPQHTAALDTLLRDRAEDGFRPVLGWVRDERVVDDLEPVSSWARFPDPVETPNSVSETV
ncbi:MAG: homocysteine S-methyltransferase family protein [Alphaproteobacteria bacterium]|nr:homocysteine S-methyltransferase family protein [Alphaproteobacteria bacterium]